MNISQRTGWPTPVIGPQLWLSNIWDRHLAIYQQSVIHSMHEKVGVGCLSHPQESLLHKYNSTFHLWVLLSSLIDVQVVEIAQTAIHWIV